MRIVAIAGALLGIAGCSSESTPTDRTNVDAASSSDAGLDADASDAKAPDSSDGRDDDPASCFAACQNTAFTCAADVTASLTPEASGCSGTLTSGAKTSTLKLDCVAKQACVDAACVSATFNAFSFAFTPSGGAKTVCTRD